MTQLLIIHYICKGEIWAIVYSIDTLSDTNLYQERLFSPLQEKMDLWDP